MNITRRKHWYYRQMLKGNCIFPWYLPQIILGVALCCNNMILASLMLMYGLNHIMSKVNCIWAEQSTELYLENRDHCRILDVQKTIGLYYNVWIMWGSKHAEQFNLKIPGNWIFWFTENLLLGTGFNSCVVASLKCTKFHCCSSFRFLSTTWGCGHYFPTQICCQK